MHGVYNTDSLSRFAMYKKVLRIVQIKTGPNENYLIIKRLHKINLDTLNIRIKLTLPFSSAYVKNKSNTFVMVSFLVTYSN